MIEPHELLVGRVYFDIYYEDKISVTLSFTPMNTAGTPRAETTSSGRAEPETIA